MKRDVLIGDVLSFNTEVWSERGDVGEASLIEVDTTSGRLGVVLYLFEWCVNRVPTSAHNGDMVYEAMVVYGGKVGWIVLDRNVNVVYRP